MASLISTLFISADGVAEIDPAWHFPYFDENMGRAVTEDYATSDVLLLGRETYDSFAGAWPDRETAGEEDAPMAKQLGDLRKVVVSRQPLEFTWRNSELLEGDRYVAGSAVLNVVTQAAQVGGFLVGGLLVAVAGARGALVVDATTFLVSAAALVVILFVPTGLLGLASLRRAS